MEGAESRVNYLSKAIRSKRSGSGSLRNRQEYLDALVTPLQELARQIAMAQEKKEERKAS